jgi:glucose-1-phosphate thymidylyltransferase
MYLGAMLAGSEVRRHPCQNRGLASPTFTQLKMGTPHVQTAVVLAAGMGTRMREPRADVLLEPAQAAMADIGLKAMIPIAGRPFLDYVLTAIADAGYQHACLVVGHQQQVLREYYTITAPPTRVRVSFAIQDAPRGTADAVAAAETVVKSEHFLMVNSDNYYPSSVLEALRSLGEMGLVAFQPQGLVAESNISWERLQKYAVVMSSADGYLEQIVEKPDSDVFASNAPNMLVSMNCWRFSPSIFTACKEISPSARHELELADAIQYSRTILGERFRVLSSRESVLDLSNRSDIPTVAAKLQHVAVRT